MFNYFKKKHLVWLLAPLSILYIVFFSLSENIKMLFLPLSLPIAILALSKPKLMGYIFLLANVQFLGITNPETFIRLPGILKFNDLLFLMLAAIYLFDVLKKGFYFPSYNKAAKTLAFIVLFFVAMVIFQFIFTSFRFELPIVSTIKVGRGYLYLLVYFYFVRFYSDGKSMQQLLSFIAIVCGVQFIMMLFQMVGLEVTSNTIIRQLESDVGNVTRVYIPAYFLSLMCFFISISLLLSNSLPSRKNTLLVIVTISFLSILLTYTRTYWFALIIGLAIIFIFSRARIKIDILKYTTMAFFLCIPFFLFQSGGFIVQRFFSIFSEVGSDEGNFIYRFSENPQRLEAFFDNPIFGPGFVHSNYAATLFNFMIDETGLSESQIERALLLQTNDSGLITLLVSFGLCGVLWVFYKMYLLIKLYQENQHTQPYQCLNCQINIQLGILAFIFSVWLTCTTTYGFTYSDGVVSLALSLFIFSFFQKSKK